MERAVMGGLAIAVLFVVIFAIIILVPTGSSARPTHVDEIDALRFLAKKAEYQKQEILAQVAKRDFDQAVARQAEIRSEVERIYDHLRQKYGLNPDCDDFDPKTFEIDWDQCKRRSGGGAPGETAKVDAGTPPHDASASAGAHRFR